VPVEFSNSLFVKRARSRFSIDECRRKSGKVVKVMPDYWKKSMILYRPVGFKELELIARSGFKAFPPRLPEQPIFYPVLNFEYAEKIARDWNTKSNSFAGFVTRFEVEDDYVQQFEIQTVGSRIHQELWVPAEQLEEFNRHIMGRITIEAAYYGEQFKEKINPETNLPARLNFSTE
jgi:hypothetical protein